MTIACFGFGASPKGDQTIDVPKDTSRVHFIGWTSIVVENSLGELDICGEYSPDEANLVRSLDPKYVESYGLILPQSDTKAKGVKPLRFYGLESLQGYLMPEGNIIGLCRNSSLATFQDEVLRTLHLYYRNAKDVAACGSSTDHLTVVIDRSTLDLHQWTASDPTPRSILQTATQDQAALLKDVAFERIWAGEAHMLALATDGTLYSWGSGRHGQLGHGDLMSLSIPKPIESLQGIRIVEAACGASFSVALSGTEIIILLRYAVF
ncbi:RCC1 domain-containing protein 1 [Mortierella sp. AM989]|nr:RCC1 domain-containing protein 1 [Mortierella sp. AM989]